MPPRKGQFRGPPHDDQFRCERYIKKRGVRCNKWKLKGSRFCEYHGGRHKTTTKKSMGVYSKLLGKRLEEAMQDFIGAPHHEQVSLYDELAVTRVIAADALKLLDASMAENISADTKALAISLAHDALEHVRDMCVAVNRIEKDADDKVSVRVIGLFVNQVVRAMQRVCGEDRELFERIEREVRETVRIPDARAMAKSVTSMVAPGEAVREMDRITAPGAEHGDQSPGEEIRDDVPPADSDA